MADEHPSLEQSALERQLSAMRPAPRGIDRDALMFAAGRRSRATTESSRVHLDHVPKTHRLALVGSLVAGIVLAVGWWTTAGRLQVARRQLVEVRAEFERQLAADAARRPASSRIEVAGVDSAVEDPHVLRPSPETGSAPGSGEWTRGVWDASRPWTVDLRDAVLESRLAQTQGMSSRGNGGESSVIRGGHRSPLTAGALLSRSELDNSLDWLNREVN